MASLAENLDKAQYVRVDAFGYVHAWFGGHGVNVYRRDGTEVHYYTFGHDLAHGSEALRETAQRIVDRTADSPDPISLDVDE